MISRAPWGLPPREVGSLPLSIDSCFANTVSAALPGLLAVHSWAVNRVKVDVEQECGWFIRQSRRLSVFSVGCSKAFYKDLV